MLVLGNSMADWLAYGLEDALGDPPEIAVVRKNRAGSGLIRYDSRNENEDWAQAIREAIAATKPKYIVMMVGMNDRVAIRDRVRRLRTPPGRGRKTPRRPAAPPPATASARADAGAERGRRADAGRTAGDCRARATGPTARQATTYRVYEFRTDQWAAHYTKRIDARSPP